MRAVVQRVTRARVSVAGEEVCAIGPGLVALVGVARSDREDDASALAHKLVHLRVFADAEGRMNRSLRDVAGELCIVSQFTLLGDARQGRRPSYAEAAPPEQAEGLVAAAVEAARREGVTVVTGRFRSEMDLELSNHGPVTILIDTKRAF